jgi:hypothetical protein
MTLPLVFSRAMAIGRGWTPEAVDREVRSGRWTALRRGVYARSDDLRGGRLRAAADVMAAQLATGYEVVGTHETAAALHGLPLLAPYAGPPRVSLVRTAGQQRPGRGGPARLVSQIPLHHRALVLGAAVTTVARTAVDLARTGSALSSVVVLDAALRSTSRAALEAVLEECRGWPGIDAARTAVAFADGRAESPLESVGRWRMHETALPPPDLQVVVGDEDGPIGRTDFLWAAHRTVGEADGFGKYRSDDGTADFAALRSEKLREDRLREAGFEVFRFTWNEALHQPYLIGVRARRAFARAGARGSLGGGGGGGGAVLPDAWG